MKEKVLSGPAFLRLKRLLRSERRPGSFIPLILSSSFPLLLHPVYFPQNAFIDLAEYQAPAADGFANHLQGFFKPVVGEAFCATTPGEGRNVFGLKTGTKDIDIHAHNGGGIEHRADAGFGVIAHDESAKQPGGFFELTRRVAVQTHVRVIVFQVGIVGISAQVTPFANHGITQKAVVSFVAVSQKNGIANFATNLAKRTNGCIATHLAAPVYG